MGDVVDPFQSLRAQSHGKGTARQWGMKMAMLASVEEAIAEKMERVGATAKVLPSPTEYFAAFLEFAETQSDSGEVENLLLGLDLWRLVFPHVNKRIIAMKFAQCSAVLTSILSSFGAESEVVTKSTILCQGALVSARPTNHWNRPDVMLVLKLIFALCDDSRGEIRRTCVDQISSLLQTSLSAGAQVLSAFSGLCVETICSSLNPAGPNAPSAVSINDVDRSGDTRIFSLLGAVLTLLPDISSQSERLAVALVNAIPRCNNLELVSLFGILRSMQTHQCTILLPRILKLTPSPADEPAVLAAFAVCVSRAIVTLADSSDGAVVLNVLVDVVKAFIVCIGPSGEAGCLEEVCQAVEKAFTVSRTESNSASMQTNVFEDSAQVLMAEIIERHSRSTRGKEMVPYLTLLCSMLRSGALSMQFVERNVMSLVDRLRAYSDKSLTESVSTALGKCAQECLMIVGVRKVVELLPLTVEDVPGVGIRCPRSYMLLAMGPAARKAKLLEVNAGFDLGVFKDTCLPLIASVDQRMSAEATMDGLPKPAFLDLQRIRDQLWHSFGAFCVNPLDVQSAMSASFARMIGEALQKDDSIRPFLCSCLSSLIEGLDDRASQSPSSSAHADLKKIGSFGKNYLPLLFQTMHTARSSHSAALLSAIHAFVKITDPKVVDSFFVSVLQKLHDTKDSADATIRGSAHLLTQLVIPFLPYIKADNVEALVNVLVAQLQEKDAVLQKRTYKALSKLLVLRKEGGGVSSWIDKNEDRIRLVLSQSSGRTPAGARKHRLYCILEVLPPLTDPSHPEFLVEAIVASRDPNGRTRAAAYDVLLGMGRRSGPPNLFTAVSAGLAGISSSMVASTLTALSRLLFEFHLEIAPAAVAQLVRAVIQLIAQPDRETATAAVGFTKIAVSALPDEMVAPLLRDLISALFAWGDSEEKPNKRFRMRVSRLLERLIRTFGFDVVDEHVPESHKKLIKNIMKQRRRAKRNKRNREAGQSSSVQFDREFHGSDSEDEEMETLGNADSLMADDRLVDESGRRRHGSGGSLVALDASGKLDLKDVLKTDTRKASVSATAANDMDEDTVVPADTKKERRKRKADEREGRKKSDGDHRKGKLEPYRYISLREAAAKRRRGSLR